ncbi:hypothetical protein M2336_000091 [Sphingobium sp. B1D7B]|uniref:hypothetical protein n=2 Tax=unclassified Sphingobium TaxID=2611147 RepID=UPI0022246C86|nr:MULTISPECIES: hypothetical protein [unclassified Sphingobium]MCW2391707.1 hypothetical protein [Sphingobium sp. B11D3A]MCW2403462.1 hypothetical protein [Sphingobium sp. B1D7B]
MIPVEKTARAGGFSTFNAADRFCRNQPAPAQFSASNMGVYEMKTLWDPGFLQSQIQQFEAQATTAMHPDEKAAYQSYVQHYQTMLKALQARGHAATLEHA